MVRRKSLRLLLQSSSQTPQSTNLRTKWIRLPFLGRHSYKMEKELKKYGYKVGFYPLLTVNNLINIKDSISPNKQSGIYRLTCGLCDSQYIGQTGPALATSTSRTIVLPTINRRKKILTRPHTVSKRATPLIQFQQSSSVPAAKVVIS